MTRFATPPFAKKSKKRAGASFSRPRKQRLPDALEARQAIGRITAGLNFDDDMQNEAVRGGGVQWFHCVAGEALNGAQQRDPALPERHPELRDVVAMRIRLVHGYFTINDLTVWTTLSGDGLAG